VSWKTRLRARLLLTIDRLLGTRLVERELARQQAKIEQLVAHIEAVNRDLDAVAGGLAFFRLALCLVELKARSERDDLDDWLRFVLQSDGAALEAHKAGDESLLDSAIECLVKPRLAAIDAEPAGPGNYVYRLHPDWAAIIAHLGGTAVAPELMSWLEEQT
jgi:hypothetical protein